MPDSSNKTIKIAKLQVSHPTPARVKAIISSDIITFSQGHNTVSIDRTLPLRSCFSLLVPRLESNCCDSFISLIVSKTNQPIMSTSVRPLFGGAISCEIPSTWRDVSDIRQVPDHQECWQEVDDSGALLVVEILERQNVSDANAAAYFFRDLAESNGSTLQQWNNRPIQISNTAAWQSNNTTLCGGMGFQKVAMGRDYDLAGQRRQDQQVKVIRVELCAFRLANKNTDLLVTISKPVANPNEPLEQQAWSEAFQKAVSTLQVRDWGLFG